MKRVFFADRPYEGTKPFSVTTTESRPLEGLLEQFQGFGAERVEVLYDGSSKGEESFISVDMAHDALQKATAYQKSGAFNFGMSEKSLFQPSSPMLTL